MRPTAEPMPGGVLLAMGGFTILMSAGSAEALAAELNEAALIVQAGGL